MWSQYHFLCEDGIDPGLVRQACEEGAQRGIVPHLLLIHRGALSPTAYLAWLEERIGQPEGRNGGGITEIVDALPLTPNEVTAAVMSVRGRGNAALLLMPQQIDWSEPPELRRIRAEQAANGLLRERPDACAGRYHATWQVMAAPILPGLAIGGLLVAPDATVVALAGLVALPFFFIVGLRVLALIAALRPPKSGPPPRIADADLPVYSVVVALFREAEVVPGLVRSLRRLDYPPEKLDILLVTESVDPATETALRRLALPPHMRVLVVPDLPPRTKPKALNYALGHARGDYVVVYDAEDDPEPDQLRRALRVFQEGEANLMCVQGRLALYNPRPGWIARQFMLEYAALFDAMLHALARLGLPIPLGGTSNHFPAAVLRSLGGWDAYNVTEDADLGIRIARAGGTVAILDSTTWEEAPERLAVWMPQRTRWMKGFMQTWLVHMRSPHKLWADLGPLGFLGFNAYLGGIVLSALVHPLVLLALAWEAAAGRLLHLPESAPGAVLFAFALFNLVGGYASGMAIAGLASARRGLKGVVPHLMLMPVYWVLISVAAYRALLQLVTNPYFWEKTPHAARDGGDAG